MVSHLNSVFLLSREYPPNSGGAGIVAHQLANYFPQYGISTKVCTGPNFLLKYPLAYKLLWFPFFVFRVCYLSSRYRHSYYVINDIGAAFVCSFLHRLGLISIEKSIYTFHGGEPGFFNAGSKREFLYKTLYKPFLHSVSRIVYVSKYMSEYSSSSFSGDIDKLKVEIIYNGVDDSIFAPINHLSSRPLSIDLLKPGLAFVTVSRITEDKGFIRMLGVFEHVHKQNPTSRWTIIGTGPFLNQLRSLVNSRGLSQSVNFLGWLPRPLIAEHFRESDIFMLLSERQAESFGLVYVEAMMTGLPCLAAKIGGVSEVVVDNHTGYLLDLTSSYSRQISAKLLNHPLASPRSISDYALKFTASNQAHAYLRLLKTL